LQIFKDTSPGILDDKYRLNTDRDGKKNNVRESLWPMQQCSLHAGTGFSVALQGSAADDAEMEVLEIPEQLHLE